MNAPVGVSVGRAPRCCYFSHSDDSSYERAGFDRMYQVDAAIIRILKARKQTDHSTLMSELPGQLKFNSTATEIKERIETLIERDYLKRDETDPSIYHYLS